MLSTDMRPELAPRKRVCIGDVARHLAYLCQGIVIGCSRGYLGLNREDRF
jgi:hypothetical protein